MTNGISSTTIERGGRCEIERPKVGPKGTQAARVAARESAEGIPDRGEMSGSERVNIDERDRASDRASPCQKHPRALVRKSEDR